MNTLRIALTAALGVALGGCALLGWTASAVQNAIPVDAAYELQDRPTLIMIDDPSRKLTTIDLSTLIAGRMADLFVAEKVVGKPNMLAGNRAAQLAADHPDFGRWPIDRVGREAGAQQVVYALVQEFRIVDEAGMYRPLAEMRVKVIDAETGKRLFPVGTDTGQPVVVEQFYRSMDGSGLSTETVLARRLSEELAVKMAQLFYAHPREPQGSTVPE